MMQWNVTTLLWQRNFEVFFAAFYCARLELNLPACKPEAVGYSVNLQNPDAILAQGCVTNVHNPDAILRHATSRASLDRFKNYTKRSSSV